VEHIADERPTGDTMDINRWLSTSLQRWFPGSEPVSLNRLKLQALRGEQVSFQVCVRIGGTDNVTPVSARIEGGEGLAVRLRRVGCVPVPHHNTATPMDELDGVGHIPGYVPDILLDEQDVGRKSRRTRCRRSG
jgi:hypothetical protein